MKRLLAFVGVLLSFCLLASGCGGCSPVGSKTIVVEPPSGEKLQKMTEAMNADQAQKAREAQKKQ